jgi:hypothetical protein
MLTALVLICSIVDTPDIRDCTRQNASTVMRVPSDFAYPAHCFMQGQVFLAGTSIGQELSESERVKVICVPTQTVGASIRVLD